MDHLFAKLGGADRLILGVSDNVPPGHQPVAAAADQDMDRAFGPVRGWR